MQPAPIPENEAERLAALRRYDVLDTPSEPEFEDLTLIAAQICGTPIALISLIDAPRQWFKSRRGLDVPELPRETAFCTHAIQRGGLLEIPDALVDQRFHDNPLVTGDPHIRFYAGAPLVTPGGFSLGTLCVIDRVPRRLTPEQRDALAALGRQVVQQLELRHERRREQERNAELARRAAFQQAVLDSAAAAIISTTVDGVITSFNRGAESLLGYAAAEVVGKFTPGVFHDAAEVSARAAELTDELGCKIVPGFDVFVARPRAGTPETREWTYVRKDGSRVPVFLSVAAMRDNAGELIGFLGVARDIAERRRAQEALRASEARLRQMNDELERLVVERTGELHESEARFRQLAEQSSEVFWFVGLDPERLLYISPAIERIWGLPVERLSQHPRTWMESVHPDDRPRVRAAYDAAINGHSARFDAEYRIVRPDGSVRWVLDSGTTIRDAVGKVIRLGGIAKDITESKHALTQRLRTQRLESIGTLAGGISHDLNNALAPILMGIELLRLQLPQAANILDTMEVSGRHAAGMVRQVLTFAKGIEGARVLIQPRHLLKEIVSLMQSTFPKNIEIEVVCPSHVDPVTGDATQLHQVLLNLCVNARDAMSRGGTLTLEVDTREIDATYASAASARPGRYVVWRVTDTGTGMPSEILERIFDPFFTTKGPDKGTGLGLSTVLGIVTSHGGFVRVYSTVGEGTTFTIHLPVAEAREAGSTSAANAKVAFRGNGETILVVDDDASVRQISRAVLTALDFSVLTAADATEAMVLVAQKRAGLRAVITDLHMPHMDGLTFVRVLKHMAPDAGIIVSSGRLMDSDAREFKALGVSALLEKPFTQDMLVTALRTIFTGEKHSGKANLRAAEQKPNKNLSHGEHPADR